MVCNSRSDPRTLRVYGWLVVLVMISSLFSSSAFLLTRPAGNSRGQPPATIVLLRGNQLHQRQQLAPGADNTKLALSASAQEPHERPSAGSLTLTILEKDERAAATATMLMKRVNKLVRLVLRPYRWLLLNGVVSRMMTTSPTLQVQSNTTTAVLASSLFHSRNSAKALQRWMWFRLLQKAILYASAAKAAVSTRWLDLFLPTTTTAATIRTKTTTADDTSTAVQPAATTTTTSEPCTTTITAVAEGPRWATASTDLSGVWTPIITTTFKQDYDEYLQKIGRPWFMRSVALQCVGSMREVIRQVDGGRQVDICCVTPAGSWNRTLISSGATAHNPEFLPLNVSVVDPDQEVVQVESWWQQQGTVHQSLLRGKAAASFGVFESTRYLEPQPSCDDVYLVCESRFHPAPGTTPQFQPAYVKWMYQRQR